MHNCTRNEIVVLQNNDFFIFHFRFSKEYPSCNEYQLKLKCTHILSLYLGTNLINVDKYSSQPEMRYVSKLNRNIYFTL